MFDDKRLVKVQDLQPGDVICSMQWIETVNKDADPMQEIGGVVNHIEIEGGEQGYGLRISLYLNEKRTIHNLAGEQQVLIFGEGHVEKWPRLSHGRESGYR